MIPFYPNYLKSSWSKLLCLIPVFIIIGCTLDNKVTGTVDETDTGILAMLYNPDGTPAIGAYVKIFEVADTTKTPISEVISDKNGNFKVKGLAKGTYNVYAEKGSLVAFQDSVKVFQDTVLIKDDTLEIPKNLSGVVGLQPNHDPRTVTVQVLGTDIYSNVNESGHFTLNRMAKGNFTLKLSTTLDNYTTTYRSIIIDKKTLDTLPDTLRLIYTGIPVVEGLTAIYDTLNGVVTLSWNKTKYRDFQDYLIYRDYFDSLNISSTPITFTKDTIFRDSIFNRAKSIGKFSFSDTNNYHFKYRVTVRNNSQQEGLSYKYIGIDAASPQRVKTVIEHQSYHINKGFITDSASVNDSIRFVFNINNPTRILKSVRYTDLQNDSVLDTHTTDSTKCFKDTVYIIWDNIGIKKLEIAVEDNGSIIWRDTVSFHIVKDLPKCIISANEIMLNDTLMVRPVLSDKYGDVTSYKWKILGGDFAIVNPHLPEFTIHCTLDTMREFFELITETQDDDGNIVIDTNKIKIKIKWQPVTSTLPLNSPYKIVSDDSSLYVFLGAGVYATNDCITWHFLGENPFSAIENISKIVFNKGSFYAVKLSNDYPNDTCRIFKLNLSGGIMEQKMPLKFFYGMFYSSDFIWSYKGSIFIGALNYHLMSVDGNTWVIDSISNAPDLFPIKTIEHNNVLYASVETGWGKDGSSKLFTLENSNQIKVIHSFVTPTNSSGSGFLPSIAFYSNKVFAFVDANAVIENRGKIICINNPSSNFVIGDIPTIKRIYYTMVLNGSIYLFAGDEIWKSK